MLEVEIRISPEDEGDQEIIKSLIAKACKIPVARLNSFRIIRRSLDARKRPPMYLLHVLVNEGENLDSQIPYFDTLPEVSIARPIHIIGAGPAGYFAALELIRIGLRPIIWDRGKDVRARRKDLKAIQQEGIVNPDSNYCFGEGGAGTYSDGKLYTRSSKRGSIDQIIQILIEAGADEAIRMDAHPHIGSNKLPPVIQHIREVIEAHGGQVHFNARLTDLRISDDSHRRMKGFVINTDQFVDADVVILATGHSARDIFSLLLEHKVHIEAKPFALGVRVEHPQPFIDTCQYGMDHRGHQLPAASYALNAQAAGRGVFSFCMCPGGLIVPAATAPGEIVVNGMSLSRRDSPYANSGVVTSVELEDVARYFAPPSGSADHPLNGVAFQHEVEKAMFEAGNGTQAAPAQRLTDFINKRLSADLPPSSYIPGLLNSRVDQLLPSWIYERLQGGIRHFNQKMKGYLHPDAVVVSTESRTSSPVRIPRDHHTGMHTEIKGLFPCGEGAGYAGGIMSAAMDGQFIARAVGHQIKENYL